MTIATKHIGFIIFLLAFSLRVWNIGIDLPNLYHPDEPHHLNIAAQFGSGDLNPHDFKYPTLWPYIIAVSFGFLFVIQRLSGSVDGVTAFAVQYVTDPTIFYLTVRILSAVFLSLACVILYRIGKKHFNTSTAHAIGFLSALSPTLLAYGRDGTHYAPMLFFVACALSALSDAQVAAHPQGAYLRAGFFMGLSISIHYVAAPVVLLLAGVGIMRSDIRRSVRILLLGCVMIGLGFMIGSPFLIVEFRQFFADIRGIGDLQKGTFWNESQFSIDRIFQLSRNLVGFIDGWGIGFLLAILGIVHSVRSGHKELTVWVLPTLVMFPILAFMYFGSLERYALAIYFPLFIPAAVGFSLCWNQPHCWRKYLVRGVLLLAFIPSVVRAVQFQQHLMLPDTRSLAKTWIEQHVEPGSAIFVMDPYKGPQLTMNIVQLKRLYERSRILHHPREEYYRLRLLGSSDRGYEVYTLKRTHQEVQDIPHRTDISYQAQDAIDVKSEGLEAFFRRGIEFIVINSPAPQDPNIGWIEGLRQRAILVTTYIPEKGVTKGMPIEIYRLKKHEHIK